MRSATARAMAAVTAAIALLSTAPALLSTAPALLSTAPALAGTAPARAGLLDGLSARTQAPLATPADPMCGWDIATVLSGGLAYATETDSFGRLPECVTYNKTRPAFSVTEPWTGPYGHVLAYPHIAVVSSAFPLRISSMGAEQVDSWSTTLHMGGLWNAALDMWVTKGRAAVASHIKAEVMVWISNTVPYKYAGQRVVKVDGTRWYVIHWGKPVPGNRNYVQFRRVRPVSHVYDLAMHPFYRAAQRLGYIDPWWYQQSLEAGFEVWAGGTGQLAITRFRAQI
jgi:hypothetical protein